MVTVILMWRSPFRLMKFRYTQSIMEPQKQGYIEIEHTADWAMHVWAPDLVSLLAQAAIGMYALSQTHLAEDSRLTRKFEIPYQDCESLVVDFLSELLFYGEDEGIGFDSFNIEADVTTCQYRFDVHGAPIVTQGKEIKAVTFHGMKVRETSLGMEVTIIFDV